MAKGLLNTTKRSVTRSSATRAVPPASLEQAKPVGMTETVPPMSVNDLVMRSVNLPRWQDDALREMAYKRRVSKNDIVRAAIACKMKEWEQGNASTFLNDLQFGLIGISD